MKACSPRVAPLIALALAELAVRLTAAPPRLVLDVPPGGPFAPGESLKVGVDLLVDAPGFKFVAFGVEAGPGAEIWFAPSLALLDLAGLEQYSDRLRDVRHVQAGLGNFSFRDTALVVPVERGRVRLGTVNIATIRGNVGGALSLSVGECRCREPGAVDPAVLYLGAEGKVELGGDAVRIPLGDLDFIRGDQNHDGRLDIGDGVGVIIRIFLSDAAPFCADEDDANDDGKLDVSDPVYLLQFLFLGGPAPPAPFPARGPDPTPDDFGCGHAPY